MSQHKSFFRPITFALAVLCACTGQAPQLHKVALQTRAATSLPGEPIDVTLRARTVRGRLDVKSAGAWHSLAEAGEAAAVTEVRAAGRGAIMEFAGAPGQNAVLWLRSNSHVRLARAPGGVRVDVVSGQARVRFAGLRAYATIRDTAIEITGRDVLLYRRGEDADVALAFTADAPDRAAWAVALESDAPPAGIGAIEVSGQNTPMELRKLDVSVEIFGDYAYTEVEHVFFNPNERQLEGTFRFPLPDGALPLGLAMEINGRMMEGEIVEREKARKTYESIVDAMQDPALLEWEQGNRFKLRVFPIEPTSEKRVVFRYATPLMPTLDGWQYVYATQAPELQTGIPRFRVRMNGRVVVDHRDFVPGEDVIVAVDQAPAAVRQVIAEPADTAGTYTAVRIAPDWSQIAPSVNDAEPRDGRALLVIVDTSRSALEGRDLALHVLELTLAELGAGDRFQVMTADIVTRLHTHGFVPASPEAASAAVSAVRAVEPDGASDLGAAFARAGELLSGQANADVLYIGDGTPTWGITDPDALRALIGEHLGVAPVHAAIIGKGASTAAWQGLTGDSTGRVAHPRTLKDARHAAFLLSRSAHTPRIQGLRVALPGDGAGTTLYPGGATTLYRGDELVALMRTAPGARPPDKLRITGRVEGKAFVQEMPIIKPAATQLVAQRWATMHIANLEAGSGDKDAIVAASKEFGVMSKHTSLLVLESEEAYAQHGIERRQALAQNTPRISGGDLESVGERRASLSPDQIQPGDPEIRIPAPADARSVVLVFPFGDTKLAAFDEHANAWVARFLIDKDTPDGKYMVLVKVTLASGQVETYELPYYVDTRAPSVTVEVKRRKNGRYVLTARQVVTEAEMIALDPGLAGKKPSAAQARILSDALRVEVQLPDGEVLALSRKRPGLFRRTWRPAAPLAGPATMRVIVTDEALNQQTYTLLVHPDGRTELSREDSAQ